MFTLYNAGLVSDQAFHSGGPEGHFDEDAGSIPHVFRNLFALSLCNRRLERIASTHTYRDMPTYVNNVGWLSEISHAKQARTTQIDRHPPGICFALDLVEQRFRPLVLSMMYSSILVTGGGTVSVPVSAEQARDIFRLPKLRTLTTGVQDPSSVARETFGTSAVRGFRLPSRLRTNDLEHAVLRVPAHLTELWLNGSDWYWQELGPALEIHRHTLRKITIVRDKLWHESLGRDQEPLDFHDFPGLKILQLVEVFLFAERDKHMVDMSALLPTNLESLSIFYDDILYYDFDDYDFDWMMRLARAKTLGNLSLEALHVVSLAAFHNEADRDIEESLELFRGGLTSLYRAFQAAETLLTITGEAGRGQGDMVLMCTEEAASERLAERPKFKVS